MADCSNVVRDSVLVMWALNSDSSILLFPCFRDTWHQSTLRMALHRVDMSCSLNRIMRMIKLVDE